MSSLRKNRDVCLIETNQTHHNKQLLLLFFLSMKTLCLSCFVGYHRSILYTFEMSFHRFHSSFICLMCPHLMSFSSTQKYLISCFHFLKITCTCVTLHSHENSEISLSSSCVEISPSLRNSAESSCCLYITSRNIHF